MCRVCKVSPFGPQMKFDALVIARAIVLYFTRRYNIHYFLYLRKKSIQIIIQYSLTRILKQHQKLNILNHIRHELHV